MRCADTATLVQTLGALDDAGTPVLLVGGTFTWNIVEGGNTWSSLYFDPMAYGVAGLLWMPVSLVVSLLMMDAGLYYSHRFMHAKFIFRYIHRWHHRYIATTPFVVTAMHPLELIMFQAATFLPMLVLPTYYLSCILVFVYILVFNIIDHSGVKLQSRLPWQGPSSFHDDHHVYFHCNFGQVLTFWDRFHDTLRREGRRYGVDVFGGKGKPIDGAVKGKQIRY